MPVIIEDTRCQLKLKTKLITVNISAKAVEISQAKDFITITQPKKQQKQLITQKITYLWSNYFQLQNYISTNK